MDTDFGKLNPDDLESYLLNIAGLGEKITQKVRGNYTFLVISHAEQVVIVSSLLVFTKSKPCSTWDVVCCP